MGRQQASEDQSCDSKGNSEREQITPGAIPFDFRGHIYIRGEVSGVPANFILDTGADNLYLDSTYFETLKSGYDSIIMGRLPGVGPTPQVIKVIQDRLSFEFSGESFNTSLVPVLNLKSITGDYGDGIIGIAYFRDKLVEINNSDGFIRVFVNKDSVDLSGFSPVKCEFRNNRLFIPVTIEIDDNKAEEGRLLVDMGSAGTVAFTSVFAKEASLETRITERILHSNQKGGIGGVSEKYSFILRSLGIGPFRVENIVADYSIDTRGALASAEHDGLLGNKILSRFDIVMDFKSHFIYLKPGKEFDMPFDLPRLGFSYVNRSRTFGSWIVSGVTRDSEAEKAGLLVEDKIVEVNGIMVSEIPYSQEIELRNLPKISIKAIRGEQILTFEFPLVPLLGNGTH